MRHRGWLGALALLVAAGVAMAQGGGGGGGGGGETVAYVNAKLITAARGAADAGEVASGVLVVRDGKIIAVGPASGVGAVVAPEGARVVDLAGKVIMPGLVDTHSHLGGVGAADGSGPIQPEVRAFDSLNVRDAGFRRAVAGGLTTLNIMPGSGHLLSGQTIYVKLRTTDAPADPREATLAGPAAQASLQIRTVEQIAYRWPDGGLMGGMKMANGTNPMRDAPFTGTRGKHAAAVRQRYIAAQEYVAKKQREAEAGKKAGDEGQAGAMGAGAAAGGGEAGGGEESKGASARDLAMEGLAEVLSGKRILHHHTHRADDIITVLRLAEEFKFRVVLHHVSESWKVPEEIVAAQKAGRVLGASAIVIDSPGGKLEAAELIFENGAALEKAGVNVCFHTDDPITDSRLFLRSPALAVRAGMGRAAALRSVTLAAADMMDLGERIGSLEAGKDADFVVLSGDPLSVYTRVEQTFVEGRKVFDLALPADRLYAEGGFGGGHDQSPYMCCAGGIASGWAWRSQQGGQGGQQENGQ